MQSTVVTEEVKIAVKKPTCGFPSAQLLAYRRRLAEEGSHAADPGRTNLIMNTILAIDNLRLFHDDVDNCSCWYQEAGSSYRSEPR